MTYDRYLMRNLLYTFGVCFIAMYGLYVVIDLFENLDELVDNNTKHGDGSISGLVRMIVTLYGYRSIIFLDRAGSALAIISVMTVLILLQRSGELHPLLAAGIPMYRILRPMVLASVLINGILVFNQEVLVPRVVFLEHECRFPNDASRSEVEPLTDHTTRISIDGKRVNLAEKKIVEPVFTLPAPGLVSEITDLESPFAKFVPLSNKHPAGWVLTHLTSPPTAELAKKLTDRGRQVVTILNESTVFVATPVTCDQLFQRSSSFTSLSTLEILDRIKCPAFSPISIHRLVLYVHSRFMQPILNVIAVLLAIPLMVRRESPGLIVDSSLCGLVLGLLFAITQGFQSLGAGEFISPELAAWGPVVFGGAMSAWLSDVIRT